eukprot:UN13863
MRSGRSKADSERTDSHRGHTSKRHVSGRSEKLGPTLPWTIRSLPAIPPRPVNGQQMSQLPRRHLTMRQPRKATQLLRCHLTKRQPRQATQSLSRHQFWKWKRTMKVLQARR